MCANHTVAEYKAIRIDIRCRPDRKNERLSAKRYGSAPLVSVMKVGLEGTEDQERHVDQNSRENRGSDCRAI